MITIIAGTNRKNSQTSNVSEAILDILESKIEDDLHLLDLSELDPGYIHDEMYDPEKMPESLKSIQDEILMKSEKWIVVVPEYNGTYPGIFKLFLDAISVRKYKECFKDRQVMLVGVSSGRAGNLRGMDHLTNVFNHVGSAVFRRKTYLSGIGGILSQDGFEENAKKMVVENIEAFISNSN